MKSPKNKSAEVKIIPPLIPLIFIGSCWLIDQYIYQLAIPASENIKIVIAYIFMFITSILFIFSLYMFMKTHQNPDPHTPTNSLYTSGIYRITRNPIYLGFVLAQIIVSIKFNNLYMILTLPLVIWLLNLLVIGPEEKYLEELFKEEYIEYKNSVRRWL